MPAPNRGTDGDWLMEKKPITPEEIAKKLQAIDPKVKVPSKYQSPIISSPLEPAVVIAGAGSGKTETMSNRVLYLVANGLVDAENILGLTFTRKAAGELAIRIRKRLRQLKRAGLIAKSASIDVTVMTYHSYAASLLSEHAIRNGIDANSQPIGDAALWQLASSVVRNWDGEFETSSAVSTVIDDLLGLSKYLLEHNVTVDELRNTTQEVLDHIAALPGTVGKATARTQRVLTNRVNLIEMVEEFDKRRKELGQLSFDDQMAIAAALAVEHQDIRLSERTRFKAVLLDEYQDTSQSQVRMLSALFGGDSGHPVMAVGDPAQSIYTWRGASAGTIHSFEHHFKKSAGQSGPKEFSLPETFRNDEVILELANSVSAQISQNPAKKLDVQALVKGPAAGPGELVVGVYEDITAEAAAVAEYIEKLWFDPARTSQDLNDQSTFAVLVRSRKLIPPIERALRARAVPVEVLGVGGLIHLPEIADIIAMMRILTDPDAGSSLMRHLAGARINLGPKDLAALGKFAKDRARALNESSHSFVAKVIAGNPDQLEADDQFSGSAIDALDEIASARQSDFTEIGWRRLLTFAQDLRRLRRRASGPIADFIIEIEQYLNLSSELYFRDGKISGTRNLELFIDEAEKFAATGGTVNDFLAWLAAAAEHERGLKFGPPEIRHDVVQILTIHNAKGGEWDVVAVPGLAKKTFPSVTSNDKANWLANEAHVPFSLRGDKSELPDFQWQRASDQKELEALITAFDGECEAIEFEEEMRLGYVAFTRAFSHLFLSTSWWRSGVNPVAKSELFTIAESLAATTSSKTIHLLPEPQRPGDKERNPSENAPETAIWPRDPLGEHRNQFDSAVAMVRGAQADSLDDEKTTSEISEWVRDSKALILERERRGSLAPVLLPARMSVSTLVALQSDPAALALHLRRPIPQLQDSFARRGTQFHLWVEKYYNDQQILDDSYLDARDQFESDTTLTALQEKWLESEWANRSDVHTEVGFEMSVAGTLLRGRIDAIFPKNGEFEVIDWKTGSTQLGEAAQVQLAVYRLAISKLYKVDISKVSAGFHYVPTGVTHKPADLLDEVGLNALLNNFEIAIL